jgi:cytochrome c-type biogenesis protein CcmH
MTATFVVIAVLMTLGALAWVLLPLLNRPARESIVERPAANLAVLRDQLAELDADLAHGAISAEQHALARAELERRALEEGQGGPETGPRPESRWLPVALGVLIPVGALSLYLVIGTPEAILASRGSHETEITPEQVERMVAGLAARLEKNPDDPAGWSLLGRSYYAMGRFAEAVAAYERAVKLAVDDAGLYADYADALAMTRDRRIDDTVLVLVNQALKLNPDHPKALVMAGTAAYERKDYAAAAGYFERLQRQVPPDTEMARVVAARIADARSKSGGKGAPPAEAPLPRATVSGRVALSPGLAAKAAASDTVFVLARAAEGPRMPLAILKRQVKDLPLDFTLSDEQAMSPQMKLSKFQEVVIVARVSRSGGAAPQPGDLQGETGAVKVGAGTVNVVIDAVVP